MFIFTTVTTPKVGSTTPRMQAYLVSPETLAASHSCPLHPPCGADGETEAPPALPLCWEPQRQSTGKGTDMGSAVCFANTTRSITFFSEKRKWDPNKGLRQKLFYPNFLIATQYWRRGTIHSSRLWSLYQAVKTLTRDTVPFVNGSCVLSEPRTYSGPSVQIIFTSVIYCFGASHGWNSGDTAFGMNYSATFRLFWSK